MFYLYGMKSLKIPNVQEGTQFNEGQTTHMIAKRITTKRVSNTNLT